MEEAPSLKICVPNKDEDLDNMALQLTIAAAVLMPRVGNNTQAEITALALFNNLRLKLLELRDNPSS